VPTQIAVSFRYSASLQQAPSNSSARADGSGMVRTRKLAVDGLAKFLGNMGNPSTLAEATSGESGGSKTSHAAPPELSGSNTPRSTQPDAPEEGPVGDRRKYDP
jgi:hypothetical protein